MILNYSLQTSIIVMIFLPVFTFLLFVPLHLVNATNTGTSEDITTGANDPTLPPSSTPDMSNTTSEEIPTGANDPTVLLPNS